MTLRRLALALTLATLVACGGEDSGRGAAPATPPAPPATVTCPVSGTPFVPGEGVTVRHGDREYETCSPGCAIRFEAEPEAFVGDGR